MENKITNEYGETWTEISNGDVVTRVTKSLEGCEWSNLKLDSVSKVKLNYVENVEESEHLVVHLYGGRNGISEWNKYLIGLLSFIIRLKDESIGAFKKVWLISLKNDCPDDVFDVYIGVRQ